MSVLNSSIETWINRVWTTSWMFHCKDRYGLVACHAKLELKNLFIANVPFSRRSQKAMQYSARGVHELWEFEASVSMTDRILNVPIKISGIDKIPQQDLSSKTIKFYL